MVADHRDAMVEAGSGRAGDAPVLWVARALSCGCSLAVRYLEARRSRGPPTEGRGLGRRVARRISSVSFLLSGDSAFGMEARTALAMASPTFDPTATGPSGLAIANHVGRLISEYTGRARRKRAQASVPTSSRWSSGTCSPRGSAASFATAAPISCSTSAGPTRPERDDPPTESKSHRTPRQPNPPRHRDRERRARPKTTGTIARMLSLRLHDAQAGGSSARRPTPSGAVVYPRPASSARELRSVLAEPAVPSRMEAVAQRGPKSSGT